MFSDFFILFSFFLHVLNTQHVPGPALHTRLFQILCVVVVVVILMRSGINKLMIFSTVSYSSPYHNMADTSIPVLKMIELREAGDVFT